jgi:hypothetical protein
MVLAAPLSLLLYLPYYVISLGVLPADGKWLWLFHAAWYIAIAAVQAWIAVKYLERRQRSKAAL